MLNRIPALILRAVILLCSVFCTVICVFAIPTFGSELKISAPAYAFIRYPAITGLYAAAGCFFLALIQFWLILDKIDKTGVFSLKNLRVIRYCAIIFSILFFVSAMPVIFWAANADDAPGVILLVAFLDALPVGVAAFTAILERVAGK